MLEGYYSDAPELGNWKIKKNEIRWLFLDALANFRTKGTVYRMKKWLTVAFLSTGLMMAKTVVIESTLPDAWPDEVLKLAAPEVVKQLWGKEEAAKKVREFLAADHPAEKKIEVLTWCSGVVERPDFLMELAALCAKAGQIDRSFYWMQRAAREDVCEVAEIESDGDFAVLVKDSRWFQFKEFLQACESQWQQSSFYRQVLTLPASYDGQSPIPLVVGLHGFGSLPEDFSGADFQRISDAQGIAFLGVSGRRALGRHAFMWTESFEKDLQHIEQAIRRCGPLLKVAPGRSVAIGFSQGGQLAAEIAAAQPNQYRGCLSMSPGSRYPSALVERLAASQASRSGQRYFFTWISGEGSGPKNRAQIWRTALEKRDAIVHEYEFPGKGHQWPRNYEDYVAITLQVLLGEKPRSE
jgi:predicted esterase